MSTVRPMIAHGLLSRDEAIIAGVEKLRFFPLAVSGGRGSRLIEVGGRELLDLSASWTAAGLGYGHPAVIDAVTHAIESPAGASGLSVISEVTIELAEQLAATLPVTSTTDVRVYLGNSGTDANDVVLRACRRATGRRRIIAFEGGYHGGLGLAMAVSHVFVKAGVSPDPDTTFLPFPDPLRPHTSDPETVRADLRERLRAELSKADVACVIIEPIQSDGGLIIPADGCLEMIAEECRSFNVPLIVDEVKVGLARTGTMHAFEYEGFTPDIITFGKSLGGGLPLSAAVGPAWILDEGTASSLLTTAGNPVCAAAGVAVLSTIQGERLDARAEQAGVILCDAVATGVAERGLDDRVGSVRGRGLTIGIDLVRGGDLSSPDPLLARKVVYRAWQLGAVVFYVGDHVLEVTPPLTISDSEILEGAELLLTAIEEADRVSDAMVAPFAGW